MSIVEAVIEGTLQSDGTLLLDHKLALRPGRVQVVLMREGGIEIPNSDPFWQRMQAIWDAQTVAGVVPRTAEQIDAEQRAMRFGWNEHQEAIERTQQESRDAEPTPRHGLDRILPVVFN